MKLIPLSRGLFAQVDDEDFDMVNRFKWSVIKCGNNFYAKRNIRVDSKVRSMSLHIYIIGKQPDGLMIDHRDANMLNDQRNNLRVCTQIQNQQNQKPRIKNQDCLKVLR